MTQIYFASNRDVKHETSIHGDVFGERFNQNGPQCFRVGIAEAKLKGKDPANDDAWTSATPGSIPKPSTPPNPRTRARSSAPARCSRTCAKC